MEQAELKFPKRYSRNYKTIKRSDQERLAKATVAVVGCGGLGGFIVEELARLGIGRLIVIDGDKHEESNLNRQLTATEETMGQWKVWAVRERLRSVNSQVEVEVHAEFLTEENAAELLEGADLVMDALDSASARLLLEKGCQELGLTVVYAAIGGWFGVLGVNFPGDQIMSRLFGGPNKGIESVLGNPAFTPAVVASLAVAEAVKIITEKPLSLKNTCLHIDLLNMKFEHFSME